MVSPLAMMSVRLRNPFQSPDIIVKPAEPYEFILVGKPAFDMVNFFKLFLETVSCFPSVALCMPGYYVQYPAILQQSLATLFPYLEKMQDRLVRSDSASPFSGAAKGNTVKTQKAKKSAQRPPRTHGKQHQHPNPTRWGPNGPVVFYAAAPPPTPIMPTDVAWCIIENQRLNTALAAMGGSSSVSGHFGMPVPPIPPANAYLSSTPKPRPYFCWLHGYNNTHNGCNCNVMGANREYTSQMKAATSPNGTGDDPKIGVPVCLHRSPSPFVYPLSCLSSSSPSRSFLPRPSQDSGPFSALFLPHAPVFTFASCMHAAPDDQVPPLLDKYKDYCLSDPR